MQTTSTFDAYRKPMPGDLGAAAAAAAEKRSSRVSRALAMCQALLVVRILTLLLLVSLLPLALPTVGIRFDNAHGLSLPLSGMDRDVLVLITGIVSAMELYLVHRLADLRRWARFGVLGLEPLIIIATTVAMSLGAAAAALPLALSVSAMCLLLLNQVRWAFRLDSQHRRLTGHRRGNVFLGYAPLPPDTPKPAQAVGYSVNHPPSD